jgi:hypothetical protein
MKKFHEVTAILMNKYQYSKQEAEQAAKIACRLK